MNRSLWIAQVVLALIFLVAGGVKLIVPIEMMTKQIALPGSLLRFIGVAEAIGAIGLILPGLVRIRPGLTPLAAAALVIVMIGAVVITLRTGSVAQAVFPFVTGLLCVFVAWGRWRLAPLPGRTGNTRR
jgi:uncharacterized membrane protein YphA (DoxX/SURF4 family)